MSKDRINAKLDQLQAAVRDKDGTKAREIMEDLQNSDPKAAQVVLDGLLACGMKRMKG